MTQRSPDQVYNDLKELIADQVKGRSDDTENDGLSTIDLILTSLYTGNHILLEDYPGSGKTFLAKILAESLDFRKDKKDYMSDFQRVQCMVDLLPTDITGTWIKEKDDWVLNYGPMFSHILLVDEINRTTPKVQSAFLEAMAEKQITINKKTLKLEPIFFLIATQNPFDRVGTFELPYAQLDRFLFKRVLSPISGEHLRQVIAMNHTPDKEEEKSPVSLAEFLSSADKLNAPLTDKEIADDLLSLHTEFSKRVSNGKPTTQSKSNQELKVISPQCSLSPRTLRLLKKAVDFRVNLERYSRGKGEVSEKETSFYDFNKHMRPLLPDLLRHRIILKDRNAHADDVMNLIKEMGENVTEASFKRQRKRHQ